LRIFTECLSSVDDLLDLQFYNLNISSIVSGSENLTEFISYIRKTRPEIPCPLPVGREVEELKGNRSSIWHALSEWKEKDSGEIYKKDLTSFRVTDADTFGDFFKNLNSNINNLIVNDRGCRLFLDKQLHARVKLSESIDTIWFWMAKKSVDVDIIEFLNHLMNPIFNKKGCNGKYPFLNVTNVSLLFGESNQENINLMMDVLEFKRDHPKEIKENNELSHLTPIQQVEISFCDKVISEELELKKLNSFLFYNTPFESCLVSFDELSLSLSADKSAYYSDDFLYVFEDPEYITTKNTNLVEKDSLMYLKFNEKLSKMPGIDELIDKIFFAVVNFGYEEITIREREYSLLPSFRDVKYVRVYANQICEKTISLLKDITASTTYVGTKADVEVTKKTIDS
jgi:hypothetical protein